MKNLPINLETFGFVEREYINGKQVRNKCGRDFLYYSLNYYYPTKFNPETNNPALIDINKVFGFPVEANFAWMMIQFYRVPSLFKKLGLELSINGKQIKSFGSFLISIISPNRKSAEEAIQEVEKAVDSGFVTGIDIAIYFFGLINHVLFVYGYDEDNLYVFDTHKIPILEYEKITQDNKYIMRIPKKIIKKRWTIFGRVWVIEKLI